MNTIYVTKIWVDKGYIFAETDGGEIAKYDLSRFNGFKNVTSDQLNKFEIINSKDIHWPDLDEDINLEGMLYDNGLCKLTPTEDSVVFRPLPETHEYVAESLG